MKSGDHYYNENDPFCCRWLAGLMDAGEIPRGHIDSRSITEVQADDLKGFTQCHFFSGLGGWPAALRLAGWPDDVSVWSGSAPCQPFSSAGKGLGEKDERHLWPEFRRLIAECRPPVVFGEQVASAEVVGTQLEAAFVIAVQDGDYARANKLAKRLTQSRGFHYWARWVDRVQADLAAEEYTFRFKVLGAHSVGSPQIRQRLFFVALTEHTRTRDGREQGHATEHGRDRPAIDVAVDRLADLHADGCDSERAGGGQVGRPEPECGGSVGGLGDTDGSQLPQHQEQPAREELAAVTGAMWDDCHTVLCRDEPEPRLRRISSQSSAFPLAYGIPRSMGPLVARLGELGIDPGVAKRIIRAARSNRAGCLKGYGNAVSLPVTIEFVRAFMETRTGSGKET